MPRKARQAEDHTRAVLGTRDRLAQMAEVAKSFRDFRPRAEVIRNVEAVPTIFPWYDHVTGVGGHPIGRFTLLHGPSNEGKTEFALGVGASFLRRAHFFGLVDAERTTTDAWVRSLMGEVADHPGFSALPVGTYEQVRAGVRDFADRVAEARARGKLHPDTSALVVVDSIRKLVPAKLWEELAKATAADEDAEKPKPRGRFGRKPPGGIDGIGGRAGQIKAAMNAAWVDELIPLLADTRTAMIVITRETTDANAEPWARDWHTGGGSALFYEASLDVRALRSWTRLPDKTVIGETHTLEIWKTKVAGKEEKVPSAKFHVSNGVDGRTPGFDLPRDLIEMGTEIGVVSKAGGRVRLGDLALGHGVEDALVTMDRDPDLLAEVERAVREASERTWVASRRV